MQIFVLRHGHAEPQQTTDEARNLTERGCADVTASINKSVSELHQIKQIWASPFVRAQQTACIARDVLSANGMTISIKTTDFITPESDPFALFNSVQEVNLSAVLLVSHQPFVGAFLDIFCGTPRGSNAMDTSSLALVDFEVAAPGCGNLRWLRHVYE